MKKYFLTTALLGAFIAPAYAADEMITGGPNTCTVDVLGVSADGATANTIAVWSINEYTLAPGEYLNVTETSVDKTTCPAGSYCVGGTGYTVDNAATSIATCPTEYPNSAAGAGAQTQCYTACTVATANIAHATEVGGNDYFGDGADACYATDCDTGYHVDGDVELVEQTPYIPVDYTLPGTGYAYIDPNGDTGDYNAGIVPEGALTTNGTWASVFDYGVVYGKASCQPSMNPAPAYIMEKAEAVMGGTMTMEEFKTGLEPIAGSAKTEFAAAILSGVMDGSKSETDMLEALWTVFMIEPDANYQATDTGQYCYCQMDGFSAITDGVLGEKTSVTSAPWVFFDGYGSADGCASYCADSCAVSLLRDDVFTRAFRAAVFGSLGALSTGVCAANTINIDWDPDNGAAHIAGQCTYDDAITLPSDPEKPGYTFTGWKLKSGN